MRLDDPSVQRKSRRALHRRLFLATAGSISGAIAVQKTCNGTVKERLKGADLSPRPAPVTASAAYCERPAAGGSVFWPFGAGASQVPARQQSLYAAGRDGLSSRGEARKTAARLPCAALRALRVTPLDSALTPGQYGRVRSRAAKRVRRAFNKARSAAALDCSRRANSLQGMRRYLGPGS